MDDQKKKTGTDNKAKNLNVSGYEIHRDILKREAARLTQLYKRPVSRSEAAQHIIELYEKMGSK